MAGRVRPAGLGAVAPDDLPDRRRLLRCRVRPTPAGESLRHRAGQSGVIEPGSDLLAGRHRRVSRLPLGHPGVHGSDVGRMVAACDASGLGVVVISCAGAVVVVSSANGLSASSEEHAAIATQAITARSFASAGS